MNKSLTQMQRAVRDALKIFPGASNAAIARSLNIPRSTVYSAREALTKRGLLRTDNASVQKVDNPLAKVLVRGEAVPTDTQLQILQYLASRPDGSASFGEIAKNIGKPRSTVYGAVRRMTCYWYQKQTQKDYVEEKRVPFSSRVTITRSGFGVSVLLGVA